MLIEFAEGKDYLNENGWPPIVHFLLSSRGVSAGQRKHAAGDTLVQGVGEIDGSGYERKSQMRPVSVAGVMEFTEMRWETVDVADWPSEVRSIVAVTARQGTPGVALCAWDLQKTGAARDLSQPNTTELAEPSYQK